MQPPRAIVSPPRPAAVPRGIPGAGSTGPTPTELHAQQLAAAQRRAEEEQIAQEAAALRAAQQVAEAEQARLNRERQEQMQRVQAVVDQLQDQLQMTQEEEDDIFADAEASLRGGEAPSAGTTEAAVASIAAFDPHDACHGGVTETWSYHDALSHPIDPDTYEYRIVTMTRDGDCIIRRYFDADSAAYSVRIESLAGPSARVATRLPQTRVGMNVCTHLPNYDVIAFSVEEWTSLERQRDAKADRPANPAQQLAATIAGAGIQPELLQLAIQHGDNLGKVAAAQRGIGADDATVPAAPVGNITVRTAKLAAPPVPPARIRR